MASTVKLAGTPDYQGNPDRLELPVNQPFTTLVHKR
jgi:hypothetical protein